MPPTPRPPPAFTWAEPGPWQFSHSNLPFWAPPILPISVFLNSAISGAWQVAQAWEPMKWASTGALERLPLAPLGGAAAGAAAGASLPLPARKSINVSASANFGWPLIDWGWAVPARSAKARSAVKVGSSNWLSELCDVLVVAPICWAKEFRSENAELPAICRGWLVSCALAGCDQAGSVELMPATVKPPSALAG